MLANLPQVEPVPLLAKPGLGRRRWEEPQRRVWSLVAVWPVAVWPLAEQSAQAAPAHTRVEVVQLKLLVAARNLQLAAQLLRASLQVAPCKSQVVASLVRRLLPATGGKVLPGGRMPVARVALEQQVQWAGRRLLAVAP